MDIYGDLHELRQDKLGEYYYLDVNSSPIPLVFYDEEGEKVVDYDRVSRMPRIQVVDDSLPLQL